MCNAEQVAESMSRAGPGVRKDSYTYNALIHACERRGLVDQALATVQQVRNIPVEGL
jgi:pentatricopeptide repeat protein